MQTSNDKISFKDVMHSMANVVNNTFVTLCGDIITSLIVGTIL